jgi:hypothetical protein
MRHTEQNNPQNVRLSVLFARFVALTMGLALPFGCVDEEDAIADDSLADDGDDDDDDDDDDDVGAAAIPDRSMDPLTLPDAVPQANYYPTHSYHSLVFEGSAAGQPIHRTLCATQSNCTFSAATPLLWTSHTLRPAGANTQFLSFWVRSEEYIQNSNPGHFGVILNASPQPHTPQTATSGRGLIVGNVSFRTQKDGCPDGHSGTAPKPHDGVNAPRSQFEVWWPSVNQKSPTANALHLNSCSNFTWQNNAWYQIELRVGQSRYMHYSVKDLYGNLLYQTSLIDQQRPGNIENNTGFAFFAINANQSQQPWKLRFTDITAGWLNLPGPQPNPWEPPYPIPMF